MAFSITWEVAGGCAVDRRSTVAILDRGPRFHLRHCLRIRTASSSQPGRSAWRAGSPAFRDHGYEPQPRNATPYSAFRTVSGDALDEQGYRRHNSDTKWGQ